jgi:hypothetical protein
MTYLVDLGHTDVSFPQANAVDLLSRANEVDWGHDVPLPGFYLASPPNPIAWAPGRVEESALNQKSL